MKVDKMGAFLALIFFLCILHKLIKMKKSLFLSILFFVIIKLSANPGSLLVIGGGSEKDSPNSWNHAAYTWAVDQSENKKVAIIAYGDADNWMPDYFVNECGAISATNFNISSPATADAQATYDDLMSYDVIFLKGGDQYNYYSTYKNTKTQQAIVDKYNAGGVICGTSAGLAVLSEVIFTAKNGTVYPDECIEDPMNTGIALADDFLGLFPGYLFDSHFTRRARFPRLVAFMANWKFNRDEDVIGLGVDEMTAIAIGKDNVGTVYGIGAAAIYEAKNSSVFSQDGDLLNADSLVVKQLLQNCSYDFSSGEITGFTNYRIPSVKEETGNYTLLLSGSDNVSQNENFIKDFARAGNTENKVLILTGTDLTVASSLESSLTSEGYYNVDIYSATPETGSSSALADKIEKARMFLFAANETAVLSAFIHEEDNGKLLKEKLRTDGIIAGFMGSDSRFAGKSVVDNYLETDASYNGQIALSEGLGLLKTTCIIPNTFINNDLFENTASAIPYAMVKDTLTYGLWLNQNNYVKYAPKSDEGTWLYAYGTSPVMILKNEGTGTAFSEQTAYGDGSDNSPSFSGFEKMLLSVFTGSYQLGSHVDVTTFVKNDFPVEPLINYDVINSELQVHVPDTNFQMRLINLRGEVVYVNETSENIAVQMGEYKKGIYILELSTEKATANYYKKLAHF